jgi:hypothetical protein
MGKPTISAGTASENGLEIPLTSGVEMTSAMLKRYLRS